MIRRLCNVTAMIATLLAVMSCSHIDDERIPMAPVHLDLGSQGYWDTYGVHTFGQSRTFVKSLRQPADFPYSGLSATGFGGVLLISGFADGDYNSPLAYDLACPVECRQDVRVAVDPSTFMAECPSCHSRYDVTEGFGRPIAGPALTDNYGMRRYRVTPSTGGGYVISY